MQEADIITTNPPFSLFRAYFAQLMEYDKKFLILGPITAFKSNDNFPVFKNQRAWFGVNSGSREFEVPDGQPYDTISDDGKKLRKFGNICWYTNLDHKKRHEELLLYQWYDNSRYPKYDNYDAIEVSQVAEIPQDYQGVMGVPISIMLKINPEQFEILGKTSRDKKHPLKTKIYTADDDPKYNDLNASAAIRNKDGLERKFERLLIRNRKCKKKPL